MIALLFLFACDKDHDSADPQGPAPDLTETLSADQARAGVVVDEAALWGGISAEGRLGDIKIYNDRARFILQGDREGSYYVETGGIIDADIVRPEGQPGRDIVDEWQGMFGLGRLQSVESIEIVDDGQLSGQAVVRVRGAEVPMGLVVGALDTPDAVVDMGLRMVTTYTLEAGSPLLQVQTTVTATDGDAIFAISDLLIGSLDAAWPWRSGSGFTDGEATELTLSGFVGKRNEGAVAMLAPTDGVLRLDSTSTLLGALGRMAVGSGPNNTLEEGDSVTWTRYYGVGPDMATLTDAWLTKAGTPTQTVSGVVEAPDGPVAGARVNILFNDEPYTVAITGEDGSFSALVPQDGKPLAWADGRGVGLYIDRPEGAAPYSPYAASGVREQVLASIQDGAVPVAQAQGRGVASAEAPLTLLQPGTVTVTLADGLPFELRLTASAPSDPDDDRLFPDRPHGRSALAWSADGSVTVPVEPGDYNLVVWRGVRYELHSQAITVTAGQDTPIALSLDQAYTLDGWLAGDPHSHAAPSGDGSIPMEDRLMVAAAVGVQLHFGTDHDHVADYRPLLAPLGLDDVLASVVADEISPVPRGHTNAYPLASVDDAPSGGAWLWWNHPGLTTSEQFALLRELYPNVILQLNHPLDNGVADHAGWSTGTISQPDRWTEDYNTVEVLNDGETGDYFLFWMDTLNRGILSAPVGVSDSHGHLSGGPGMNLTFLAMDEDPKNYSDDALRQAMLQRNTIASLGPFLDVDVMPGSVLTSPTTVHVEALSPSWIVVDTLSLLKNGEVVSTVSGTEADFDLGGDTDASFVVLATGSKSMSPISGDRPWAITSAYLYDADGDGWEPPLPPLQ